ncbi:MAG: spore maturation protein [Clostridiaceae bacterium]|jgi:spore maturation protein B|nr:spore maturation protein [Clostridiaceae bacterium]
MFQHVMNLISLWALPFIIISILTVALVKKIPLYESFTEGAKDGFKVSINIIPYLVAIMVGISMFRASGAIEILSHLMNGFLTHFHIPVDVLPLMIVRSLSGSAALGVFSDIAHTAGANSYATKLAAVMVGSSETTFYVLAVYFGAVGISKLRYSMLVGILADLVGIVAAVIVCSHMFL